MGKYNFVALNCRWKDFDESDLVIGTQVLLTRIPREAIDEAISHLKDLRHVKWLRLWDIPVTNSIVDSLARLPELQELEIDYCIIADAEFKQLSRLSRLRYLGIPDFLVDSPRIDELQRALPKCKIYSCKDYHRGF